MGKDHADASARRQRKESELNALNNGVAVVPENGDNGHRSIEAAVMEYLEETKLTKKPKTLAAYTTALNYFTESCPKLFLEDIERKDLLKFCAFLRDDKDQAPRSCWNKFANVMSFLKTNGIRGLVKKNDWPRYTEEEPEIYEQVELDKLFKACDEEERLWYEFFLMTGMREQEVMYTYWSDINLAHATVRVSDKPDRGLTPKAYKEREIPIPAKLVKKLKAWKVKADKVCGGIPSAMETRIGPVTLAMDSDGTCNNSKHTRTFCCVLFQAWTTHLPKRFSRPMECDLNSWLCGLPRLLCFPLRPACTLCDCDFLTCRCGQSTSWSG